MRNALSTLVCVLILAAGDMAYGQGGVADVFPAPVFERTQMSQEDRAFMEVVGNTSSWQRRAESMEILWRNGVIGQTPYHLQQFGSRTLNNPTFTGRYRWYQHLSQIPFDFPISTNGRTLTGAFCNDAQGILQGSDEQLADYALIASRPLLGALNDTNNEFARAVQSLDYDGYPALFYCGEAALQRDPVGSVGTAVSLIIYRSTYAMNTELYVHPETGHNLLSYAFRYRSVGARLVPDEQFVSILNHFLDQGVDASHTLPDGMSVVVLMYYRVRWGRSPISEDERPYLQAAFNALHEHGADMAAVDASGSSLPRAMLLAGDTVMAEWYSSEFGVPY